MLAELIAEKSAEIQAAGLCQWGYKEPAARRNVPYVAYWAVVRRRIATLKKTWGLSHANAKKQAKGELTDSGIYCVLAHLLPNSEKGD